MTEAVSGTERIFGLSITRVKYRSELILRGSTAAPRKEAET